MVDFLRQARVGFIGCGRFATEAIYPSLRLAPVDLVAVCSRTDDKAERTARAFGARRWYTDYQVMLDREELDGVFVITGPESHPDIVCDVLESGRHAFVEKPPAMTLAETKRMVDTSKRTARFCQVGFMKRFAPAYRAARDIVADASFGAPRQVVGTFSGASSSPDPWRFTIGMTIHYLDMLRFLLGEVEEVVAYAPLQDGTVVTSALLRFASGATGLLASGAHLDWQGPTESLQVTGRVDQVAVENAVELRRYGHAADDLATSVPGAPIAVWRPNFTPIGEINQTIGLLGYVAEVRHFARCLLDGTTPEVTIEDGYEAMRLCAAVFNSHGDRVRVASIA